VKLTHFNPQHYEFPDSMTTFANGSGRIDIKLFIFLFCPFRELPWFWSVVYY